MMNNRLTEFLLPDLGVRGAIVEYESGVDTMLGSRPYPADVRKLLAQTVAAMPLLASHTKLEGRISLQFQHSHGPVQLLVAQVEHSTMAADVGMRVRGMAKAGDDAHGDFAALLQGGQLGLLLEPERGGQNYQAIVGIEGQHLAEALEFYFAQSEQLPTLLRLAYDGQHIRGMMLQRLPLGEKNSSEDHWQHVSVLFNTLQEAELAETPGLTLLRRLFHEDDVRVFDPQPVQLACRCSRDGIGAMLRSLGEAEIEEHLQEHGKFDVTCEFCGREYSFSADDARKLFVPANSQPSNETRH
ncbi:Hsp33 family molecular chaperone HslO [Solimonas marina]|uniref:Hsp33 family molecular chaperone HslO n=1 Tax=Solimonas marina TaxID=2714601 RepID=A0A970BAY7_9GAMM|nr:Hsp33 family molecular chaperone HslO [Solimonas marina]NKF23856.1 Hsp33 family molecular chaperone HslO [Solimonas marina]